MVIKKVEEDCQFKHETPSKAEEAFSVIKKVEEDCHFKHETQLKTKEEEFSSKQNTTEMEQVKPKRASALKALEKIKLSRENCAKLDSELEKIDFLNENFYSIFQNKNLKEEDTILLQEEKEKILERVGSVLSGNEIEVSEANSVIHNSQVIKRKESAPKKFFFNENDFLSPPLKKKKKDRLCRINTKKNTGYKTVTPKKKSVIAVGDNPPCVLSQTPKVKKVTFKDKIDKKPHNKNIKELTPILIKKEHETSFIWGKPKEVVEIVNVVNLGFNRKDDTFVDFEFFSSEQEDD